jgi:hypothetical protein
MTDGNFFMGVFQCMVYLCVHPDQLLTGYENEKVNTLHLVLHALELCQAAHYAQGTYMRPHI